MTLALDHVAVADLEVLRSWCNRYHGEVKTIGSIVPEQPLGILYIQQQKMKETSIPQPERLIELLERSMPW